MDAYHPDTLCGLLPQKDLPGVYNKLDVFIFPTIRLAETLGLVGRFFYADAINTLISGLLVKSLVTNFQIGRAHV